MRFVAADSGQPIDDVATEWCTPSCASKTAPRRTRAETSLAAARHFDRLGWSPEGLRQRGFQGARAVCGG